LFGFSKINQTENEGKMKNLLKIFLLLAVFSMAAGPSIALASPIFGDGGAALQDVLNDITVAGDSSVDVVNDMVNEGLDDYWAQTAAGGSFATFIVEVAEFADDTIFGLYDSKDPSNWVELFNGTYTPGDQAVFSIKGDGSVYVNLSDSGIDFAQNRFGFFLDSSSNANGGRFYSDTVLNTDGVDHMAAYQGTGEQVQLPGASPGSWTNNEFVMAWEAESGGGDAEYTDLVAMIESVETVPEPGSLAAFGFGIIGLFGIMRRRFRG
jgi:hypothetical protein